MTERSVLPTHPTTQDQENQMDVDAARQAKVEELQRRRSARGTDGSTTGPAPTVAATRPRGGVAHGSKIAAAAVGFSAMLGMVAAMGVASTGSAAAPASPAPTVPPPQVVVVIHPADGGATTAVVPSTPGAVAATPSQPIVLSAQPTVRQAPASQAPAGQTNGSR